MSVYDGETLLEEIHFTIHPHLGTRITTLGQTTLYDELHIELFNEGNIVVFVGLKNTPLPVTFTEVGNYNITIFGANGYVRQYDFTVLNSSLEELEQGVITTDFTLDPTPFQSLEINGKQITEPYTFDLYGFYYVKTVGVNGYSQFRVLYNPIPEEVIREDEYKELDITINHALEITINGEILEEDTTIKQLGYYTITFKGLLDFERTYQITIVEDPIRIDEGEILKEFSHKALEADLFLNGEPYTPNTKITTIGDYIFIVKGINGYEKEFHFSIRHEYPFEDQEKLTEPLNINIDAKIIYLNGNKIEPGYRIHETDSYRIVIIGEGGYREEFRITYSNPNDPYIPVFNVVAYSLAGVVAVLYGIILWRRTR